LKNEPFVVSCFDEDDDPTPTQGCHVAVDKFSLLPNYLTTNNLIEHIDTLRFVHNDTKPFSLKNLILTFLHCPFLSFKVLFHFESYPGCPVLIWQPCHPPFHLNLE
jgi:hypothetical protein